MTALPCPDLLKLVDCLQHFRPVGKRKAPRTSKQKYLPRYDGKAVRASLEADFISILKTS